jgi:hypothetical protein
MTTVLLSVEVICDTASENKDVREVSDRDLDEQYVPMFGEALAAFKRMQCYMSSFPIDKASTQQLIQPEKELILCQKCQTKQTMFLHYLKKKSIWVCMLAFLFISQDSIQHAWNLHCSHECDSVQVFHVSTLLLRYSTEVKRASITA